MKNHSHFFRSDESFTGPRYPGNAGEFTMDELAKIIKALKDLSLEFIYKQFLFDDTKQRQLDITLAHHQLGWEFAGKLKEGLMLSIKYFV
jgi:UDP-glucuronate decarboxylase